MRAIASKRIFQVFSCCLAGFLIFKLGEGIWDGITMRRQMARVRDNPRIVQGGRIEGLAKIHKTVDTYHVSFSYEVNGSKLEGKCFNDYPLKLKTVIRQKFIPVVFDEHDKSNAFPLVLPEDFEYFNLPFPDSLDWVKQALLE